MNQQFNPMLYPGLFPVYQKAIVSEINGDKSYANILNAEVLITTCVADYFKIKVSTLLGRKRERNISVPRQMAIALIRQHTELSYEKIAAYFNRDHSTIIYAIRTIDDLTRTDKKIRADMLAIQKLI